MPLLEQEPPSTTEQNLDAPLSAPPFPLTDEPEVKPVLAHETADLIAEAGHVFGKREVRIAADRVTVHNEHGLELRRFPMSDIVTARIEPLVGGARLELTTKSAGIVPVAEFTASHSERFSELARGIEQLAKGDPFDIKLYREATRCAKCNRLLPEKDGRCPACVRRAAVLRRILSYIGPYRNQAITVTAMALLSTVSALAMPFLTRQITDHVLGNQQTPAQAWPMLLFYVLLMVVAQAGTAVFETIKGWNVAFLSGNIAKDLRNHVYRSLQRLQLTFYDKKQIGSIISRVTQDTDRIWGFLVDGLPYLVSASLMLVGTAIFGLWMNWKLTVAILAPVPLVGLAATFFWRPLSTLFYRVGQRWGRFHTQLNESMHGIRVVKAFAQEEREWAKFDRRNRDLAEAGINADRRWYVFMGGMMFFTSWGVIINWLYGGYMVLSGELSFGSLLAAQQLLWQVYGPLQWFAQVNQWFSRAMAGAERIFEVVDSETEAYEDKDAIPLADLKGDVSFKKVRFGYDKSNPVLKDIELDVKAGEMIGLVGRSGAGKSTTVNLLCRFYEVDSGLLTIDGIDIKKLALQDLRRHIGIVLQEPFLFAGTIAENIAYGEQDATPEQIMAAARAACAHDFIVAKPDGYQTQVGEKGAKLSGGERQRVAIARAILHNPRILILDEATSSVDVETEKKIQIAIGNLVKGRTTFAIAHRLSTLRNADRLVVLEKGKIVETGTHAELIERQGEFYKLVQTQAETSKAIAVAELE